MKVLEALLQKIDTGVLFTSSRFKNVNLDQILDTRDNSAFENAWLATYESVNQQFAGFLETCPEALQTIEKISKNVFLAVSEITQQHEIAAYVSDDMELIAKALLVDPTHEFINALLDAYESEAFYDQWTSYEK